MTPPPEDRLDRIERIVEQNSIAINGLQESTRQNVTAINGLQESTRQNVTAINGLQELTRQNAIAINGLQESIATLGGRVDLLTDDITLLTTTIADYIVEAEEDRIVIKQNQAHIQQILDYLYNRNGGSPPPST